MKNKSINDFIIIVLLIISTIIGNISFASSDLQIIYHDKHINLNNPPILENGVIFIPLRELCEEVGFEVGYDDIEKIALVNKDNIEMKLPINKSKIYINGLLIDLKNESFIKDGKTYVSIRDFFESLLIDVNWDAKNKAVIIG